MIVAYPTGSSFDVVVIGEALVEFSSELPLFEAEHFVRSFSGDALNAAAAAAASGAHTALVTRVGNDEFGDALCSFASELGVDVSLVVRTEEPNGMYFTSQDPFGDRHFVYHRRGSAASGLNPDDLDIDSLSTCRVLLTSGVGCAISASSEATIYRAAQIVHDAGGKVIYDPNFRPRLDSVDGARRHLAELSRLAHVVTPSCPHDTSTLWDTEDPNVAVRTCRAAGAVIGIVTLGEHGILVDDGEHVARLPAAPAARVVDATGCGDAFSGSLAAMIAAGEPIDSAIHKSAQLASRCLEHRGGTGYLLATPSPDGQATRRPTALEQQLSPTQTS